MKTVHLLTLHTTPQTLLQINDVSKRAEVLEDAIFTLRELASTLCAFVEASDQGKVRFDELPRVPGSAWSEEGVRRLEDDTAALRGLLAGHQGAS